MRIDRRIAAAAACVMAVALTQCAKSVTAPQSTRTHSVVTTAQVPATPTAPVTLATSDPESQVQVTLDVATLQQIVQLAGGPATIKMTDMAPVDYTSLPAGESAQIGNKTMAVLVFDIQRSAAASVGLSVASGDADANAAAAQGTGSMAFKVKNNTGRRCTPGKVDLLQIFGSASSLLNSNVTIDDDTPLQNIVGSSDSITLAVRHFIFDFECPRIVPGTGAIGGD